MITIRIPGRKEYQLRHLVLDVNGTIAVDGSLINGVADRLRQLSDQLEIHLLTADTHDKLDEINRGLGIEGHRIPAGNETEAKAHFVDQLGSDSVIAVGNGSNDAAMLARAGLGLAVLGPEGLSVETLKDADVVAGDIHTALDLLLNPKRLIATLRR